MNLKYINKAFFKIIKSILFFVLITGFIQLSAQVTTLTNWTLHAHTVSTDAIAANYTIPTGTNSNRMLVVAIASSRTRVGTRTVTVTYGGQALTLASSDMGIATIRQHTAIYYLNEAGLDAAVGTGLSVTVSNGTTRITDVWYAVFDGVNQSTPITNYQNYNSGTTNVNTFEYRTALTVNAYNQAVEVISTLIGASTFPPTFSTFPTNWTSVNEQTWTFREGVRNAIASRTIPTTNTTDLSTVTLNAAALASMTGISLNNAPKYFRSVVTTGLWTDLSTWQESFNNSTWVAATTLPTAIDAQVTIQTGNTVTLTGATVSPNLIVNGTLDAATYLLTGTGTLTANNGSNILIGGTSNFPSGFTTTTLNTGSTVNYYGAAQTVASRNYANLTFSGSSTKTLQTGTTSITGNLTFAGTASATAVVGLTIGGNLTIGSGTTFSAGAFTHNIAGNWTNNGGTFTPGTSTVTMNGSGSIIGGTATTTYNNLTINNAGGASLGISTTISNLLTLTSGNLTTTSSNLLTITNTSTNAIAGGSSSSFINGPVKRNLPSGLVSGSTYNFPVGNGTTYLPFSLVNPTTSGAASAQVETVVGTSGGTTNTDGTLASKSNSEYWSLTTTGSFTNSSVSITRPTAISPNDVVGGSSTLTGTYTSLLGTAGTNSVSNSNVIGTNRFFVFARELKSITTGAISGTTFCSGASVSVPYTILGTYVSGNVFTAQLSNASGSFASPVTIGTVTSTNSGSISATIPSNTPTGTGYRIRVVSSNPAITGTDNGTNLSIYIFPTAPTTTGSFICIGTTTGTVLSASGAVSGEVYKWYDAATDGTLLKTSTNNTDNTYTTPTISTTTSYWVSISNSGGCETARTQVTATYPTASASDQTTAGSNSWIGHIYDGTNLNTYYGTFTQDETFDQSFTGATTCFPFTSGVNTYSILTETFSVRYRMNSTKRGLYTVDLGSDDGSRLYVDGVLAINNWSDQAFTSRPGVLLSLTGTSALIYDFYENGGQNRVVFQNLTPILANSLSTNTTQNLDLGATGSAISGDTYGTLPSGISLSGTGYQWTYSTTPGGARTNISGATSATFTPNASIAPFSTPGTYYIYRNAVLSSSNNVSPNPYTASNESNAAIITVYTPEISSSTATLSGFTYIVGNGPSAQQSFTVSGTHLGGNLTITPPTNYEISTTSESGFQSAAINLTPTSGTVSNTIIYVRLKASLTAGNYNAEDIVITSANATTVNVSCSGTVTTPTISTSVSSLPQFSYNSGAGPSAQQSFTVSGTSLKASITLTPTSRFEISTTSGSGFQSTPIILTQSGGIVNTTTIYVRLKAGLPNGNYNSESIIATSTDAQTQTVSLTGIVNAIYCNSSGNTFYSTSITLVNFNTINNISAKPSGYSNYTAQTTTVNAGDSYNLTVNLNTDGNYTIHAMVWFDWNNDGDFDDVGESYSLGTATNTVNGPTNLSPKSISIPAVSGNVRMRISAKWNVAPTSCETNFDGEVEDYTIIVNTPNPVISATPNTLTNFTYQLTAGPSAIQSFNANGTHLTDNVTVTSSTNFEVSTTGGVNFSAQPFITLPASGASVNQTVYVRMKAGLNLGTVPAENVIISTPGASDVNVSCSGSVTARPVINVNLTNLSGFSATFKGSASTTQNFTISGSNLLENVTLEAPTGYEIKTSAQSVYVTSLSLAPTDTTLATTTINVRLKSGLGVGDYDGNIVASSPYADNKTVMLSGTVYPVATITTNTSWLAGFIYSGAGPSASQTFQLYGTNLGTNNVTITPPADFELSTNGSTWNTTAFTISPTSGSVNQILYARLRAGRTAGTSYGPQNVSLSAPGAVVKTVALNGFVADVATILVSKDTLTGFGYLFGSGPSVSQSVTVSGALLSNNITVTPPASFEIYNPATGQYQSTNLTLTRSGTTVQATEVQIRLKAGLTATNYSENLTISSSPVTSKTVALSGKVYATPLITSTGGGNYCVGDNINLTSDGVDVESRFWTGPNSFYSILNNPTLTNATQAMSGDYTVTGNVIVGGNLIFNGDFELGNTGVGSSYSYVAPAANALQPEDLYTIVALPSSVHSNFNSVANHTAAPGTLQMVINGNRTAGVVVWSQSVQVVNNANYEFSYWLQTVVNGVDPAPSKLQLYVNGEMAGPVYTANPNSGIWTRYIYNTNSGSNNILNLELINQTTAANGNDFALDDISFKQILSSTSTENVVVSPIVTASVTVTHSPSNVYQNIPVVFTANPVNGGETPTYKWFVGGVVQDGEESQTFSYTPTTLGDVTITCEMTSSIQCASPKPASGSDAITVQTPPANYWMGYIDTDWGKPGNWTAGFVPATGDNVIYATVANFGTAAMRDLQLDINRTIGSLINATIRKLIIPANRTLNCNSVISVTPPVTNPVTKAEDLIYIYASTSLPNGSIIYRNPQNLPAYGTIEMYSPASWDLSRPINQKYNWQYFGIPVASLPTLPTFYGAYVRQLIESDPDTATHWQALNNYSVLVPFRGYELCQKNANTLYTFKGQFVNSNFNSGQMAKTVGALYPGQHLYANPYTTAIDIRQIEFGTNVEATAYLYNTGTFINWRSNPSKSVLLESAVPGQYNSAPKNQAGSFPGIPRQIPSMGTFMVRIPSANQSTAQSYVALDYNKVAMGNSERLKAKGVTLTDEQTTTGIIVEGEFGADRMWLMSNENYSRDFDNGYDGKKIIGNALSPQIYAVERDGNYQINSVDDINNTTLAFKAGLDKEYKITFNHNDLTLQKYSKIFLHDLVENRIVNITQDGSEYTFNATSGSKQAIRFKVIAQTTENALANNALSKVYYFDNKMYIQNFSDVNGKVYVYDISGRTVAIKTISANENIQIKAPNNTIYIVKTVIGTTTETSKILFQ